MSRYGGRRSGGDLAYGDDYERGGGYDRGYGGGGGGGAQRWDRDRFERMSGRSRGPPRGGDSFHFEEDDYYSRGGDRRRDVKVDIEEDRPRRGGGYRDSYDHYAFDDERYEAPRRARPDYLDDDRYRADERQLAPYRPTPSRQDRYVERDYYDIQDRKPSRPQFVRRQTSLDFDDRRDRKYRPRYGDEEEHNVNVNVDFHGPQQPRAPEPPRYDHRDDRDFYRDNEYDDYRDVHIYREKERDIYRRRGDGYGGYEEVLEKPKNKKKKSHARFPKRLAELRCIVDLGYPFEEDVNNYWVQKRDGVITQDEVDFVINRSKALKGESENIEIDINENRMLEAPPEEPREQEDEIIETTTTKIIENPTEEDLERLREGGGEIREESTHSDHRSHAPSRKSKSRHQKSRQSKRSSSSSSEKTEKQFGRLSVQDASRSGARSKSKGRSKSRGRHHHDQIYFESNDDNDQSQSLVLPSREKSRSRREIDNDIYRLEAEKKAIRRENKLRAEEEERNRDEDEYEIVDDKDIRVERGDRGQLQFERDIPEKKRNKSRRRRATQGDVNAALFSLT